MGEVGNLQHCYHEARKYENSMQNFLYDTSFFPVSLSSLKKKKNTKTKLDFHKTSVSLLLGSFAMFHLFILNEMSTFIPPLSTCLCKYIL